jgi:acyl-CoA synthetase (AMP-forming)/AMP-acid ligase II
MPETVRKAILEHSERQPERLYVRCLMPDGSVRPVTYQDLVRRGSRISAELEDKGAGRGDIVIVILPHSPDLFCAFFGAVLGGQVPSILSPPSFKLNPEHYRAELEALLARIDAKVVVTDAETASMLGVTGGKLGPSALLLVEDVPPAAADVPDVSVSPDDLVLLQHSSGSTGLKKGVALSNRAVLNQVEAYAPTIGLNAQDHIVSWLPLYHDMGLIACTVLPAVAGVPVTAISPLQWVTRPGIMLQAISEYSATLAWMPNFAYEFLAQRVRASQIGNVRLDSMRGWINCAEPTIASSHRRFLERFQPLGVRPETLWTCYAMAETVFAVSQSSSEVPPRVERLDRERFQTTKTAAPVVGDAPCVEAMSAGVLLEGTEVRIVDDSRRDLPERSIGEIGIRCGSLFTGYFHDPDTTARSLDQGWYYSGDLGYMAEGHLFVTGRSKDLLIIAGKNYYPQDIERVVSAVPGIYPGRVVALGLDDPSIGTQRLIVLAEVEDPVKVDDPELGGQVRRLLAGELDCTIDDLRLLPHMSLLKTSSGKVARAPNLAHYRESLRASRCSVESSETPSTSASHQQSQGGGALAD